MKDNWIVQVLCVFLAGLQIVRSQSVYPEQSPFVRIHDGKFVTDDCKEFFFSGFNGWELIEISIGYPGSLPPDTTFTGDKNLLEYILDEAMAAGLNVIRIFGHGTTSSVSTQKYCCAGEYKEEVLQGLDHILDEMAKRDMKIILTFGDNWRRDFPDTVQYYVNQSSTANSHDDFFFDEQAKQMYKNHINFMINRVNTFNGRKYRDDPTIFAWNIINEPRCRNEACVRGTGMAEWIDEMALYIKGLDPNHLLTVGEEGFYKLRCNHQYNPDLWATENGQDSPRDHASEHIDYLSSHIWLDNWGMAGNLDFITTWIQGKIQEAKLLGKPLVLQEFGKGTQSMSDAGEIASVRDPVYQLVYSILEAELSNGGPFRGALFWTWNYGHLHEQFFGQGIMKGDSTWNIIQTHSSLISLNRLQSPPVPGCIPGRFPTSNSNKFVDPNSLIQADFETCCSSDCNALNGEVYGQQSVDTVQTSSAEECCDQCKLNDGCEGYSWCGCSAGCSGYGFQDCVMKRLPFKEYPLTEITGEHVKFVSGVPNVQINKDVQCQIGAQCIKQLDSCTSDQFASSIQCAESDCNTVQGNSIGEPIYMDYEVETGNPVSSPAECCAACKTVPGCSTWSFCMELDVCQNERGLSCVLKSTDQVAFWSQGPRQPWISGHLNL